MSAFTKITDPDTLLELNANPEPAMSLISDEKVLKQLREGFSPEIETVLNSQIDKINTPQTQDPETWADWISPALELSSALAVIGPATAKGAAIGAPLGPAGSVVGGLITGVAASAAAVYASRFAGENIEDLNCRSVFGYRISSCDGTRHKNRCFKCFAGAI